MDALSVLENICDHPRLITNRQCLDLGLEMPPGVDIDSQGAAVACLTSVTFLTTS